MAPLPLVTALFLLAFFASKPSLASNDEEAPPGGKKVIDGWAKRDPAVRSLRFMWVKTTEIDMHIPRRRDKRPVPPKPLPLESKEILTIKGDRMRFETVGPAYNERDNAYVNQQYVSTNNGALSKSFYDLSGGNPWRPGFIMTRADNQDCDNYHLRPMMLFCLPLSPKYSRFGNTGGWKLGGTAREIRGRRCRALINGNETYWFDPSRGNAVLLYELATESVVLFRQEIFYKDDPKYGSIPSRWTTRAYAGNNAVVESSSVSVLHYEINKDYDDKIFDVTFPPGTEVRDDPAKRFYRLEKDGTKQDIVR